MAEKISAAGATPRPRKPGEPLPSPAAVAATLVAWRLVSVTSRKVTRLPSPESNVSWLARTLPTSKINSRTPAPSRS